MSLPKWRQKALVHQVISRFPFKERINYFFQRYVTKGILLNDEHFGLKLDHARDHARYFGEYGTGFSGKNALEVGTGWYPIIPVALFCCGLEKIYTLDIYAWMTKGTRLTTIQKFVEWHRSGKLSNWLPQALPERLAMLEKIAAEGAGWTVEAIDEALKMQYLIGDARKVPFGNAYFDYICTNNTLGHIGPDDLRAIFREFRRLLKPKGVMSHFLDLSDNFSNMDESITIYNFLQYTPAEWAQLDSPLLPQNRLRWPEYQAIFNETGLPIVKSDLRPGDVILLQQMPLAEIFRKFAPDDAAISHAHTVSVG